MPEFASGIWVWLEDEEDIHILAKVMKGFDRGEEGELALNGDVTMIKVLEATETDNFKLRICRDVPTSQTKDLIKLGDLRYVHHGNCSIINNNHAFSSEETLLHCLRIRFARDHIYTNVGTILVSANPYKVIPALYDDQMLDSYLEHNNSDPHIWQVAGRAHASLVEHATVSQSILISGIHINCYYM
jgi:myosin heavy subunit